MFVSKTIYAFMQAALSTNQNSWLRFSILIPIPTPPMYLVCVKIAFVIYYLEEVPGFYPQLPEEKNNAAVARMLMFLFLYTTNNLVFLSSTVKELDWTEFYKISNIASRFSFAGKLKISCDPNIVGLNKKIGVAQQWIKRGTEFPVSPVGHWLGREKRMTAANMFVLNETTCDWSSAVEIYWITQWMMN